MSRTRIALASLAVVIAGLMANRNGVHAQSPTRADTGDAAVAALVSEVRALRADMAAASRNQLRAQVLLGRVQMQEQRLAYLDKQRSETAAQAAQQNLMTSSIRMSRGPGSQADSCTVMPSAEGRRECEAQQTMLRQQLSELESREQQLQTQERDLENALAAEQARWSDFNSRLDELERTLR